MSEEHAADPNDGRKGVQDQRSCCNRARAAHDSTAIGRALAREAAEQIEHAPAPRGDEVAGGEKLKITDRPRPLEGAEDDVVGIGRGGAGQEILALHRAAQRGQAFAESRQPRVAILDHLLESSTEALLTRFPEIGLVFGPDVTMDVEDDKTDEAGLEHRLGPVLYES